MKGRTSTTDELYAQTGPSNPYKNQSEDSNEIDLNRVSCILPVQSPEVKGNEVKIKSERYCRRPWKYTIRC